MALQFRLDAPHPLSDLLASLLLRHRDWWSRNVIATCEDSGPILLTGSVTSYYHKQLAQTAVLQLHPEAIVQNDLVVQYR